VSRFTVREVAEATGGHVQRGAQSRELFGVATDSREVRPGQLFVAISGPSFDGNAFARAALDAGAGAVLVSDPAVAATLPSDAVVIVHTDTRRALVDLGAWHRSRLECPVFAITGSVGKTSTKNILATLLERAGPTVRAPKSFNNAIGVPYTLLLADEHTRAVVLEVGTSAPGEIGALARIARPNVGVITLIGHGHLEQLGDLDGVCKEKGALGAALTPDDHLVLNADDPYCERLRAMTRATVHTFSVAGAVAGAQVPTGAAQRADLVATDVATDAHGTRFRVRGRSVHVPLVGVHHVANVVAAFAALDALRLPFFEYAPAQSELQGAPHRMQRIEVGGLVLVDDTYNSNLDSARAAVRALSSLPSAKRRVMVLGDMLELGAQSERLHHQLGMDVAAARFELLVCVGELAAAIAAGALQSGMASDRVVHCTDTAAAAACLDDRLRTGDTVLFKASRGLALERVVEHVVATHREEVRRG
jgi:UDP-N-acetylmuramoyl-tripeptide--D-alanyl-D-alanine ligase